MMTILADKKTSNLTFEEFIADKPEDKFYELHEGVAVEMPQPRGKHEEIKGFLAVEFASAIRSMQKKYFLPNQAFVRLPASESAYLPDILVLDPANLINEPLWESASTVMMGETIPLVVEVVSTNWRVDYLTKLRDYEEIGIAEYWIVDYLGVGASRFIGDPKQPSILIHSLRDGEYRVNLYQGEASLASSIFPELRLTANCVFEAVK